MKHALIDVAKDWLVMTTLAALFFIIAPRLSTSNTKGWPPISVAVLVPATVYGIVSLFRFFTRIRQ